MYASITPSKKIFLIDAIGAFSTAFLLYFLLLRFNIYFGMPLPLLYPLISIALLLMLFSLGCYYFLYTDWKPYLKALILANSLYSCLTISLVWYCYSQLTPLGIVYFLLENIVIGFLIGLEWRLLLKKES